MKSSKPASTKSPTIEIFENWKNDFLKIEDTKDFNIYLVGSFADELNNTFSAENLIKFANIDINKEYTDEELDNMSDMEIMLIDRALSKPGDIDIIITGPDDRQKIKKLLYEGKRLGFEKYNITVEMWWREHLLFYNLIDGINYSPEYIGTSKYETDNFAGLAIGMSIPGNIYVITNHIPESVEVCDGLWKVYSSNVSKKHAQKISMGYEYPIPILISKYN